MISDLTGAHQCLGSPPSLFNAVVPLRSDNWIKGPGYCSRKRSLLNCIQLQTTSLAITHNIHTDRAYSFCSFDIKFPLDPTNNLGLEVLCEQQAISHAISKPIYLLHMAFFDVQTLYQQGQKAALTKTSEAFEKYS